MTRTQRSSRTRRGLTQVQCGCALELSSCTQEGYAQPVLQRSCRTPTTLSCPGMLAPLLAARRMLLKRGVAVAVALWPKLHHLWTGLHPAQHCSPARSTSRSRQKKATTPRSSGACMRQHSGRTRCDGWTLLRPRSCDATTCSARTWADPASAKSAGDPANVDLV